MLYLRGSGLLHMEENNGGFTTHGEPRFKSLELGLNSRKKQRITLISSPVNFASKVRKVRKPQ